MVLGKERQNRCKKKCNEYEMASRVVIGLDVEVSRRIAGRIVLCRAKRLHALEQRRCLAGERLPTLSHRDQRLECIDFDRQRLQFDRSQPERVRNH